MPLNLPSLKNLTNPNYGKPPEQQNPLLGVLGKPHIDSFNYMLESGLDAAIADIQPVEFELPNKDRICLNIEDANIGYPAAPLGVIGIKNQQIYPTECRQRGTSYKGKLCIRVSWTINGKMQVAFDKDLGDIPIMLKSNRCHLAHMSPQELVDRKEHEEEWGGYFVIKGLERLVRMLVMTRRNYPIAVQRSTWKGRGNLFSDWGITIRCVKLDQTTTNNVLHFVTDGTAKFMFSHRKALFYVPLLLLMKALVDYTDFYMYSKLMEGCDGNLHYSDCIQNMMRAVHEEGLHTHEDCKTYIAKMFRVRMYECPEWYTDEQVADIIFKNCILIHLDKPEDKFNLLVFMTKKLFSCVEEKSKVEGVDSVMMHETLLGGHLYLQILKERLQSWLANLKLTILKRVKANTTFSLDQREMLTSAKYTGTLEHTFEMFLATGNIASRSGLGLMQDTGLTIVAENISRMRYMSHFRAIHRGAFFQEMRTTEARRLLPDAWGFICPVHTPDGAPCGLLNHLTVHCQVTDAAKPELVRNVPSVLHGLGMEWLGDEYTDFENSYVTMLDGKIIGYVPKKIAVDLVKKFRLLKIKGDFVPKTTEIVLVPLKKTKSQYAGLFLFTGPARLMRPVINLQANEIELVGSFEQVYMEVCVMMEESYEGVTTHMEISKTAFLSNLANLIPLPDCNQSPRNMYQCQMGKQTMGTACHNWDIQSANKLYRLQTPTSPLFRPVHHDNIGMDSFGMGTNAIVAVISYTGYDMEDAIVINKASEERGLMHGSIYKSEFIELENASSYFCRDPSKPDLVDKLDTDGLPYIGRRMNEGEPLYCFFNAEESLYIVVSYKSKEECFVNTVKLCGDFNLKAKKIACISYRVSRNPSVGDKFASRAGQKGICSQKYPVEDLPFTETGLVPDIMFNPHGFPSRMTIAMMIEIMAGKSGALDGLVHDATPFKFNEEHTAIDYFGRLLEDAGYNYYGNETMYSGIDGREFEVQIFLGVVHYQRLRHMVSDKWQVRSTGTMDMVTRQPIKGRKRGGGIRFGEMERDALISHGASFLLQDRLLHCSDVTTAQICTKCSSLLGPITIVTRMSDKENLRETKETCRLCDSDDYVEEIQIPYIFKFFVTQLASCNINIKVHCKHV